MSKWSEVVIQRYLTVIAVVLGSIFSLLGFGGIFLILRWNSCEDCGVQFSTKELPILVTILVVGLLMLSASVVSARRLKGYRSDDT